MKTCILMLVLLCMARPALAQGEDLLTQQQIVRLYGDASDEITEEAARALLLLLANDERRQAGLAELLPLELAGFMARRHAGQMAREGYSAHYDVDGRNPVERYNRLGGTDYVQENLILLEIDWPLLLTERMVRSFHREWMDSPEHRRTLLSPQATQFGSAFELHRDGELYRMAAVCEFVCELGDYSRLPQQASAGDQLELSGQFLPGVQSGYVGLGLQDSPTALSLAQLNARPPFYTLPEEGWQMEMEPGAFADQGRALPGARIEYSVLSNSFRMYLQVPQGWEGQTLYFYVFAVPPGDDTLRCVACQTVEIQG